MVKYLSNHFTEQFAESSEILSSLKCNRKKINYCMILVGLILISFSINILENRKW